jgi:ubiquinone/menaquinone biosynthesis C-methylase UbiE
LTALTPFRPVFEVVRLQPLVPCQYFSSSGEEFPVRFQEYGELSLSGKAASFIGNIPQEYERGLGSVIFADYAADMARRVAALAPARVLEMAAGTGILTRRLRDLLPESTSLMATDLHLPMLDVARGKFRSDERVDFQPADGTNLPFRDGAFDAVVCQFGIMFFPDKDRSYREAHRVLAPGGRYLFSIWDSHRHNPFGRIAHEVAGSFFPGDPPQFYQVPFAFHAIDPIKESLIDAGFTDIRIHIIALEKEILNAASFARGLVYGNPLIDEIRIRDGTRPDQIVSALTKALYHEFAPSGRMQLQAILFDTGRC